MIMKTKILIIGSLALVLGFSACQNKSSETDGESTSMDMNGGNMMNMDSSMNTGMMAEMDKMMNSMHRMEMTGNADNDFAMMMKMHHEGAVQMTQVELSSGKDESVKSMAQKISDAQKSEINDLNMFLNSHKEIVKDYDPARKDEGFAKGMGMGMNMMMGLPEMGAGVSVDQQFVRMMIPHHQSAVAVAEEFIKHSKDAKLLAMARKIIADQRKEIEEFEKLKDNQ